MTVATEDCTLTITTPVVDEPVNLEFPLYAENELVVTCTGGVIAQLNVDYTITLYPPDYATAEIVPKAGLLTKASGYPVFVERRTNSLQPLNMPINGRLPETAIERELDRAAMRTAEMRRAIDATTERIDASVLQLGRGTTQWDARTYRISALGMPVNPADAASKTYVDTLVGAGDVIDGLALDLTFTGQNATVLNESFGVDSRAFYVAGGGGGFFADYDCKAARTFVVRQAENQLARGYGGFRDGLFVHHADEDVADYTGLFQNVSYGVRSVVTGKMTAGVFQKQYKDFVAGEFAAIARVDWPDRGVSGVTANVFQYGRGIGSNEFSVEQPATANEQSLSLAAVQAIMRQRFAPSDGTHKARGVLISNEGYSITAGIDILSVGGFGGVFETGIDMVSAFVSQQGIRMPQTGGVGPAHAGTLILYDGGDYSGYDRAANRFFWIIDSASALTIGKDVASIGPVTPSAQAFLALPAGTSTKASLLLTPGAAPVSGGNGLVSCTNTALYVILGGAVRQVALV